MGATDGVTREAESESDGTKNALPYVGAILTALVAAIHLFHPEHGIIGLASALTANPTALVFDPRPLAFVLSGTALFVGLSLSRNAPNRRPYYAAGVLIAATYVVGYFAWHFTGHGGFLPGREPLFHGLTPVENVASHLTGDAWAAASKLAEVGMALTVGLLYRRA
ncbi:hypothetical protein [Halobellus rarus]|uniref:Uncharacterized protein n=1 Tax=Halobellus rarus TaxID=1126237 RepID=A0ABD6CP41_9EURY|nr:hypothetical protein [Halobellus rarus]